MFCRLDYPESGQHASVSAFKCYNTDNRGYILSTCRCGNIELLGFCFAFSPFAVPLTYCFPTGLVRILYHFSYVDVSTVHVQIFSITRA